MPSKQADSYAHGDPQRRPDRLEDEAGSSPEGSASGKRIGSSPGAALRAAGPFLHIGIQVGLTMVVAAGFGYLVDGWLGTSPWGLLIGCLFGVVAVFVVLFRMVAELNAQSSQRNMPKASPEAPKGRREDG